MDGDEAMQRARGHAKITSFRHPSMHKEPPCQHAHGNPMCMLSRPRHGHMHDAKVMAAQRDHVAKATACPRACCLKYPREAK